MNTQRMIDNFIKLIKIHSPSSKEGKISIYLEEELKKRNLKVYLDMGHLSYGGERGNLVAKLHGNKEKEAITLMAHMDVVEPNEGVNPSLVDGKIITDGTTTLGADDKGGIAIILEVLDSLIESGADHPDIYVLLTTCEETSLLGAKSMQWDKIPGELYPAKNMIVIDNGGKSGHIAHTAPTLSRISIVFNGRKAHAGIEPEKGISAPFVASHAVCQFKQGRIDEETTANIGRMITDVPTNVVADKCEIEMEIRSHNEEKLNSIVKEYEDICQSTANKFGANVDFKVECDFPTLKPTDNLKFATEFSKEYEKLGVKSSLVVIGGGSDANIFAKEGFNSIIVGCGMYDVHTTREYLVIEDMENTANAIIGYLKR